MSAASNSVTYVPVLGTRRTNPCPCKAMSASRTTGVPTFICIATSRSTIASPGRTVGNIRVPGRGTATHSDPLCQPGLQLAGERLRPRVTTTVAFPFPPRTGDREFTAVQVNVLQGLGNAPVWSLSCSAGAKPAGVSYSFTQRPGIEEWSEV